MKKTIMKGMLFAFTMFCFPFVMFAMEVANTTELDNCLKTTGNTCKLTADIDYGSIDYKMISGKEITVDLNGHLLKGSAGYGVFYISTGGHLIIKDSSTAKTGKLENTMSGGDAIGLNKNGKLTVEGGTLYGKSAAVYCYDNEEKGTIIVNGGTLYGYYYAVNLFNNDEITLNDGTLQAHGFVLANNGTITKATTINIKGGKILQLDEDNEAIYHPGIGTVNISGGLLKGGTGIEMRSGTLNVTGGTIEAVASTIKTVKNANGPSMNKGIGIAVSQHVTKNPININVYGGTIKGYAPLYQKNVEENDQTALDKINLNVKGGKFIVTQSGTQAVYSENFEKFITGGNYSIDIDSKYILKPYQSIKLEDNTYLVTLVSENKIEAIDLKTQTDHALIGINEKDLEKSENIFLDTIEKNKELFEDVKDHDISIVLETEETESINEQVKKALEAKLPKEGMNLGFYDINIVIYEKGTTNKLGNITELTKPITITLVLPNDLKPLKKGYTRTFYIARNHDGKVDLLNTTLSKDGKSITFNSDKFSEYTLVYQDITNPKTGDSTWLYIILSLLSIIALFGFTYKFNRE